MDVKSEASCPTCAQIIDFYINAKGATSKVLGNASSLIDTECAHRKWFKSLVPDSVEGPIELSLRKVYSSIQLQSRGQKHWAQTSLHELVSRSCTGRGLGRLLDPSWIDEGVILGWKDLCSTSHGDACENPVRLERVDSVQPTWLIDTVDGCLVPGSPQVRYVALSYVRGAAALLHHERGNTDELQKPGGLLKGDLAKRLPATIKDAIAIVPLLGERFLWVDSLCIVQDDKASLQIELDAMSRIYKSSCKYGPRFPPFHDIVVFLQFLALLTVTCDYRLDHRRCRWHRRHSRTAGVQRADLTSQASTGDRPVGRLRSTGCTLEDAQVEQDFQCLSLTRVDLPRIFVCKKAHHI